MNKTTVVQQAKTASWLLPGQGLLQRKCACGNHTAAGEECDECAKNKSSLQRKLAIGASNDPLEREADRVADQVMAAPAYSFVGSASPRIQRYSGEATEGMDTAPASVDRILVGSGSPLEPALRQDMEQRFGHDFSQVRVHSGASAEQSAREVNANAYTVGHHIVFGEGQLAPGTHEGRRLIAHELTHVVQQSSSVDKPATGNVTQNPLKKVSSQNAFSLTEGSPDDRFEQKAGRAADSVMNSGYGFFRTTGLINTQANRSIIQRQHNTASPSRKEQRDSQLRQFARFPRKALEQWKTLKVIERDAVLREMSKIYGEGFTYDFTEYAFGIKRPNISGAIIQSTPKELIAKGYRYAGNGNVWVHPSGHEIFLMSPPAKSDKKPEETYEYGGVTYYKSGKIASYPKSMESKCMLVCLNENTKDEEECSDCCVENIPANDPGCLNFCITSCQDYFKD